MASVLVVPLLPCFVFSISLAIVLWVVFWFRPTEVPPRRLFFVRDDIETQLMLELARRGGAKSTKSRKHESWFVSSPVFRAELRALTPPLTPQVAVFSFSLHVELWGVVGGRSICNLFSLLCFFSVFVLLSGFFFTNNDKQTR